MIAAFADIGWASAAGAPPSDRAGTCRACGREVCHHPDAVFAGVVPAQQFARDSQPNGLGCGDERVPVHVDIVTSGAPR